MRTRVHLQRAHVMRLAAAALVVFLASGRASAEDATTREIRLVMEENLAACNEEDLPRLMATMSEEMPNRELFIQETKREWAASDCYTRLIEIEILKHSNAPHANTRPPYATVRVVQEMLSGERKSDEPPTEWARRMSLNQGSPVAEHQMLWKKERGKWRIVAGLTEPRPVEVHRQPRP